MSESTVTGKAALLALIDGQGLKAPVGSFRQFSNGVLMYYFDEDSVDGQSDATLNSILEADWEVCPRIGDAPAWSE